MTGILALLLTGSLLFSLLYFPRLLKTDLWHSVSPPPSFAPPSTKHTHPTSKLQLLLLLLDLIFTVPLQKLLCFFCSSSDFFLGESRPCIYVSVCTRTFPYENLGVYNSNPPSVRNSPFKEVNIQRNEMCNRALKLTLTNVNKITLKKKDEKGQKNKYKLRQKTL